ncbi:unnamed protein product, partial [Ectocarpus sp. 12 AP-2014]
MCGSGNHGHTKNDEKRKQFEKQIEKQLKREYRSTEGAEEAQLQRISTAAPSVMTPPASVLLLLWVHAQLGRLARDDNDDLPSFRDLQVSFGVVLCCSLRSLWQAQANGMSDPMRLLRVFRLRG